MKKVYTKGDVIVNEIKIGDIHYEYESNLGIIVEVLTLPIRNDDSQWTWTSKKINDGKIINYLVTEGMEHYGPNLYTNEAYAGIKYV